MSITNDDFMKLPLPVSTPEEQQKIADCLSSLDELIGLETQKLDAIKAHKRGLMQQLFPRENESVPRLRFSEFREAGGWELKAIGDSCESFSGGTPSTTNKIFYGGEIPFIRSAEIDKDETELFLSEEGLNNSAAKIVEIGDILVALYGANSGDVAISKINGAIINQAILCLRHETNNRFVYQYLSLKKNWIIRKFVQGGQGNLSGEIMKAVCLFFPKPKEQERIADCLSSIDDLIKAQGQKIGAIKIYKKGLMQQLFPALDEVSA
ncbi:restriction endonuclease subunit S [Chromobacterium haemolyticum]|nr:restriction endonuclease subunit S [Chromobacterium haemolyticum]